MTASGSGRTGKRPGILDIPRWLPACALALSIAGVLVSAYLTYEHFTVSSELVCPNTGSLDCESVTSSAQSKLFGIPVAILGLAYFVGMCAIVAPAAWRAANPRIRLLLNVARLAGTGGGVVYVLYLIYAELFLIGSICIWCTVVHVLSFALFGVVAFGTAMISPPPASASTARGQGVGRPRVPTGTQRRGVEGQTDA